MPTVLELFQKTLSLATAIAAGERVSDERIAKRLAICTTCPKVTIKKKGDEETLACSICGCRLKGDRSLTNLLLYEETNTYGCKKNGGSEWKKNGV